MAKPKKANTKAIADVAKPGESAPSANSKSVIVNSRPILKDPMVVDEALSTDDSRSDKPSKDVPGSNNKSHQQPPNDPGLAAEAAKPAGSTAPTKVVRPPDAADKPEVTEAQKTSEGTSSTDESVAADVPTKEGVKQDKAEASASEQSKSDSAEEGSASPVKDQQLDAEATEQAKHKAAIEKLVDSKQYYLPINSVEKRRSRRFVALGIVLSLLLVLAWADIALDAGLIRLGNIKPVTHFFSN